MILHAESVTRFGYVNSDGRFVSGLKAEWDAPAFIEIIDLGVLVPAAFMGYDW